MNVIPQARGLQSPAQASVNMWRATIAGFCASLVGIGLARFAYTPLLPAIIAAHWFDASAAAYLGAANLAGYLIGALAGRPVAARTTDAAALRSAMALATISFFACAWPLSFAWFFAWRFLAGLAGGALMVLAAPAVLAHVPPSRRGLAAGVIFMGVGTGIVLSGTLVPLLLQHDLRHAWVGLSALSLLLTTIAWKGWPAKAGPARAHAPVAHAQGRALPVGPLRATYVEYALNAAGWVPHMIFLVDFIARGLGRGVAVGAGYWVIFGVGATIGPVLAGALADRTGFGPALRIGFILEIVGVAIPALGRDPAWLIVSSLIVGAFVTGTVPLVLGRIHELLAHHPSLQGPAWRTATVGFALFQAVAAYGLSFLFAHDGQDYRLLFVIGTAAMVLALFIDIVAMIAYRGQAAGAGQ
ncbi:MAG: YbfB/YjiJ family MFS transporter [Bordetella sp.]|uniref:YbfB/YjiJ family MFS transporter n=1 Tax=Bordetella sp. TaxID=28081 RepID=UPI003F7CA141